VIAYRCGVALVSNQTVDLLHTTDRFASPKPERTFQGTRPSIDDNLQSVCILRHSLTSSTHSLSSLALDLVPAQQPPSLTLSDSALLSCVYSLRSSLDSLEEILILINPRDHSPRQSCTDQQKGLGKQHDLYDE
jgi:hypothetical protein